MSTDNTPLIPTSLAIQAMRDNGYRNTAYAIAELIDNSITAGATRVELLCMEREALVRERERRNIHQIAVLDNGRGMDVPVLLAALQFGNGEYLNDRTGISRFGMGLPSSSISQCSLVEVWTWQEDADAALYSYINLDEVKAGQQSTVPLPERRPVPTVWRDAAISVDDHGTLVVWSQLDRCQWKTARTIIKNSEFAIGRMYRRFIHSGRVSIRMMSFLEDYPDDPIEDKWAQANDPGYLLVQTSTPAPYDEVPMFEHHGDKWEWSHIVTIDGQEHKITARFTIAKPDVRNAHGSGQPAGATPYGKHAKQNVGVSLVRADRELELEMSFVDPSEPRDRWWGVEIEFPPSLDEVFGVTNNKQEARHFTDMANTIEDLLEDEGGQNAAREALAEIGDPRVPLVEVTSMVQRLVRQMRQLLRVQQKGSRQRHKIADPESAERTATDVTRRRQQEGSRGVSDPGESEPPMDRQRDLALALVDSGYNESDAAVLAEQTVTSDLKYVFAETSLEGRMFFTVSPVGGEVFIRLNSEHPAYENLIDLLADDPDENLTPDEALARLRRAHLGIKLLLISWAQFEDEARPDSYRRMAQDIRTDWGRYAWDYLENQ